MNHQQDSLQYYEMTISMDPDVKKLVEFMHFNFDQSKLVAVAEGVAVIAPIIWANYQHEKLPDTVIRLNPPPIMSIND